MFEREGKREKILEVRNREIRLKLKSKISSQGVIDEDKAKDEAAIVDNALQAAETEFFEVIKKQLEKLQPQPEEEEEAPEPEPEPEPEVEEPPPPPPPPPPEPKKGKKGKKKGKKK